MIYVKFMQNDIALDFDALPELEYPDPEWMPPQVAQQRILLALKHASTMSVAEEVRKYVV